MTDIDSDRGHHGRHPSRLRAAVDHIVSRGPLTVGVMLAVTLLVIAIVASLLRWLIEPSQPIGSGLWQSITRLFDTGSYDNDVGAGERIIGMILILIGLVGSSTLLAIVVTGFQDIVDRVRNGRSPLLKKSDTVILGWSHEIYTLIGELNASPMAHPRIAILSHHQRVWMDESLRVVFGRARRRYAIDCRTGDRADPADLHLVGTDQASRIIVLADAESSGEGDMIRTIFALLKHGVDTATQRVIVEVADVHHERLLKSVFGRSIEVIAAHDVLTHVLTQSVRDKGFGQIFDKLTSYQDADFYAHDLPDEVAGASFGAVLTRCTNAIPIGLDRDGSVELLPAMDSTVAPADRIIVVGSDNATPTFDPALAEPASPGVLDEVEWSNQQILLIGWNMIADPTLAELSGFLDRRSTIDVIVDATAMSDHETASLAASEHLNQVITAASPVKTLGAIRERLVERTYDAVAIFPYRDDLSATDADSRSLLYLAIVQDTVDPDATRVVCELRESRTATLVDQLEPDDLVLSDALAASVMAQMTDRPWLTNVLADLFDFHGSALFAHPLTRWGLDPTEPVTFDEVISAAAHHSEIAIGVRVGTEVTLAPTRDRRIRFDVGDAVYVLGPANR